MNNNTNFLISVHKGDTCQTIMLEEDLFITVLHKMYVLDTDVYIVLLIKLEKHPGQITYVKIFANRWYGHL